MARWQDKKPATLRSYREGRVQLIAELGGRCEDCGTDHKLEFHHKHERTWVASQTSRWVRLARYRREANRKLIVLLCGPCNKKRGKPKTNNCGFCGDPLPDDGLCPCGS